MKIIKGDLIKLALAGEFHTIIHGCNCFHTMGAGIAAQIAEKFPSAFEADKNTKYGDWKKLGSYSWVTEKNIRIINAYTQFHPGPHFEYTALAKFLEELFWDCYSAFRTTNLGKVGLPLIGCGIGAGQQDTVLEILEDFITKWSIDHWTIVEYKP